jgi:hypothetical protein
MHVHLFDSYLTREALRCFRRAVTITFRTTIEVVGHHDAGQVSMAIHGGVSEEAQAHCDLDVVPLCASHVFVEGSQ